MNRSCVLAARLCCAAVRRESGEGGSNPGGSVGLIEDVRSARTKTTQTWCSSATPFEESHRCAVSCLL